MNFGTLLCFTSKSDQAAGWKGRGACAGAGAGAIGPLSASLALWDLCLWRGVSCALMLHRDEEHRW